VLVSYHFRLIYYLAIIGPFRFRDQKGHFHQFQSIECHLCPLRLSYLVLDHRLSHSYYRPGIYLYPIHPLYLIYFLQEVLSLLNFQKDFYWIQINYLTYHRSFHFISSD